MDKPLWGLRVDGLSGRRFLRDLSLTRFWREGCCRAPLIYRRRPLMKKPLQLHLLKRVPPACKGGEDHEVARGAADWRSGPQWTILSVLCPVHPFPLRGTSPQGETRYMKRKTGESYASCTTPAFPPLVAGATTFPPQAGALWVLSHGAMSLQESIERFILPPEQGEVRRSGKGGRAQRANPQNAYHAI